MQEKEEFLFEGQDCLDEDPIIPDKRFAIISLASPELIMNVKERWFKVRGFAHNIQKAMSLINVLQESDKMFNMIIVEVGKWAPVNFKTISQMRKLSVQEDPGLRPRWCEDAGEGSDDSGDEAATENQK